jgi:hypothetical protein
VGAFLLKILTSNKPRKIYGPVSKRNLFETCFLKEMLKKELGLQYLLIYLIYLVSLIGTLGASPEPDAMHPKVLRPTNDPVSTQP